ncbi:MAG: hypothetical protein HS113_12280 [Verrucomicrobiales bacterium]|nr:hypothetical protein [Verrucomicrobiales bacterium]
MIENERPSETELQRQRDTVRRAMLRTHTAVAAILAAVLILALAAVLASVQAWRNQQRAETSQRVSEQQLWHAYLEQARAHRLTARAGSRSRALAALRQAAALRPSLELRNEAIACLSLLDFEELPFLAAPSTEDFHFHDLTPDFTQFARVHRTGATELRRLHDDHLLVNLDPATARLGTNRIVTWARFSPDGRHLGLGFLDSALLVWRLEDAQPVLVRTLPGPGSLIPPVFSPDGRWFAYHHPTLSGGEGLSLLELATGEEIAVPGVGPYYACAIAPHRPWLALGSGRQVRLVNYQTRETVRTLDHPAEIGRIEWSGDGGKLAVACTHGDVFLWDFAPEHFHVLTGHAEFVGTLAFSPDNRWLLTAGNDRTTRLWDCEQGQELLRTSEGEALRFHQDGAEIGFVRGVAGLGRWRLVTPQSVRTLPVQAYGNEPNRPFDLSPDGRWLAALAPQGLQLWDLTTSDRDQFERFPPSHSRQRFASWSVTFGPRNDGLLICYAGLLEWWGIATNTAGQLTGIASRRSLPLPADAEARQATLSLDGRTALVELPNLEMLVLDLLGERPPVALAGRGRIYYPSLAGTATGAGRFGLSPDGRWAAVGKDVGPNPGPTVWDTHTGKVVGSFDTPGVVGFSPDGQWLGGGNVGNLALWRTGDWQVERTLTTATPGTEVAAFQAWPRHARWLVTSQSRQAVAVVEPDTGQPLASFSMPERQSATGLRLSHDGARLVVATARNLLITWDVHSLRRELAAWNLDWHDPPPPTEPGSEPATAAMAHNSRKPSVIIALGLLLVLAAAAVAAGILRRHRTAILQFVRSEALAEQRRRELESARIELLHSQKMTALGTLAAGIAHDFNNLLSVIRMAGKLIGREAPDHPEIREHVAAIEEAVQQGKQVVGSMLGYSRTPGSEEAARDVDALVEETVALLSKEFLSGITLTLELHRSLPPATLGNGKLEQVLLNLIVNAAEAMHGQGRLRLATRPRTDPGQPLVLPPPPPPRFIELTVEDNGPGIPANLRDRIFEPFFTTKREGNRPGTGLGLSLVYTIAQQEGLGLALDTAPGQGTRFRLLIPVAAP